MMSRDLISNPFLFPPTGDNEEEKGLFLTHAEKIKSDILFQLKDFHQVWQAAEEESLETQDKYLFPVSSLSPAISTASTELLSFDSEMDDDLMTDFNNFDFDHCEFSPIFPGNDLEKDSFSLKEKSLSEDEKQGFVQTTNQAIHQINDLGELTMFPASNNNFGKKMPAEEDSSQLLGSDLIEGESVWLPGSNAFNILDIAANDPVPSQLIESTDLPTINPTAITVYPVGENSQAINVKVDSVNTSTQFISRPGRQRRKSVVLNRNIQEDSPMTFHQDEESVDLEALTQTEVKPEPTFALATLNGTSNRSRNVSASSSYANFASPSPSKARASKNSEAERRKRKYECEDETDPSVKNAKAAKMNRDKKKMQMQQLQKQVTDLSGENQDLKQKLEDERRVRLQNDEQNTQQINILTQMLQTEQSKNAANSKQKVTMFDLMRNMVSAVQPAPTVICLTDRLGSTPMPDPSEMDNIRAMSSQQPATGLDTYLSVKVGIGGIPSITFDCENSKHD